MVGETQLGSLVGDVPPQKGYWKGVKKFSENMIYILSWMKFIVEWAEVENYSILNTMELIPILFVLEKILRVVVYHFICSLKS